MLNNIQVPAEKQQQTSTSFVKLYKQIEVLIAQQDYFQIKKLLEGEQRLTEFLTYFKEAGIEAYDKVDKLKQNWLFGAEISQYMKNLLLQPLTEELNLELPRLLELFEWYFESNRSVYEQMVLSDTRMTEINQARRQTIQTNQNPQLEQQKKQEFDMWFANLKKQCQDVVARVRSLYFAERFSLIDIAMFLSNERQEDIQKIAKEIFRKASAISNLIKSLVRNLNWEKEFGKLTLEKSEILSNYIFKEQILLLTTLLSYWRENPAKKEDQEAFLDYLTKTEYNGKTRSSQMYRGSPLESMQKEQIKTIGQLAALAMMQLTSGRPQLLAQLNADPNQLTQASSFVVLPMALLSRQIDKYAEVLDRAPIMEQFQEIMNWSLSFEAQTIKGQAIELLSNWLNMFFEFVTSKQGAARNNNLVDQILEKGILLLNDQSTITSIWAAGIKSLKIFGEVFNKPVENFERLIVILTRLCGTSKSPHAEKVMKYISEVQLWPEIFGWVTIKTQQLFEQKLDIVEVAALCSVFTLVSKIIRQNYMSLDTLTDFYTKTVTSHREKKIKIHFDPSRTGGRHSAQQSARNYSYVQENEEATQFEQGDFPIVKILVKALHVFFALEADHRGKVVKNILEALTKIYRHYPDTQSYIMDLFYKSSQQTQSRLPILIEHFSTSNDSNPLQIVSFLKFIRGAFKQPNPFSSLPLDQIYSPEHNFLTLALYKVYCPVVEQFRLITIVSEKNKSLLMNELFRLTLVLLSKFDQVPDDGQKILLVQSTPYFDYQLHELSKVLNLPQINQMCLDQLSIVQSRLQENGSGFVNKTSNEQGHLIQSRHFVLMIISALEVLNKLLSLSLSTGPEKQENMSVQTSYIQTLQSVQDLKNCISDGTTLRMPDQTVLTIPALVSYYVRPSDNLSLQEKIQSNALKFLTLSLQILGHPNILATLRNTYGQNLTDQLMSPFTKNLNLEQRIHLSIAFVDFWIAAVETQTSLVEALWTPANSKAISDCLSNQFRGVFPFLKDTLKQKICILVSLMAKKRCCLKVVQHNAQFLVQNIFDTVIVPLLERMKDYQEPQFNGNTLMIAQNMQATVAELVSGYTAKTTLYYFIKLIQSEFEREPSSKTIRLLIEQLYRNQVFQSISMQQNPLEMFQGLFNLVDEVNDKYLRDRDSRPRQHIEQSVYLTAMSRLPGFSDRFTIGNQSNLYSQEGSVYLSSLQCVEAFEKIQKTEPYHFYSSEVSVAKSNGFYGSQFIVDVAELEYKLPQESYATDQLYHICCIFRELNLVFSSVCLNHSILKAKAEFILSVAQTQMLQVQKKNVSGNLVLTSSLLPLVSGEEIYPANQDQIVKQSLQLVEQSMNSIKMLNQSIDKQRDKVENKIFNKNLESQIQMIIVHLGIVGHLISSLNKEPNIMKEIPDVMIVLLSQLPDNGFFKGESQEAHLLFCQLISLVLQILVTLGQKCHSAALLKSLGYIISGMQMGYCLTEGIQIFILICDMLDADSLTALMTRQSQGSPLQLLITRISDPKISSEEMQLILTLLQNYARSVQGSETLFKTKVVLYLINSESFRLLNSQNPYIITNQEQNRNSVHTWWLQVLVLIRQINMNLIKSPRTQDCFYFKDMNKIIRELQPRFQDVLQVTLQSVAPSATGQGCVISIAVLEETELICSVLSQMFQHADLWFETDRQTYSDMKDLMLFAVPIIFNNCATFRILPSSLTERHLAGISVSSLERGQAQAFGNQMERTALQLKMEMSLIKALMACTASLNNIFAIQKQTPQLRMIQTWGRIDNANKNNFETTYLMSQVKEPLLQNAFENYLKCMRGLRELYLNLRVPQNQVKKMIETVANIFLNDPWVQSEYQGGLASILIEESFDELIENIEVTLGMGMFVLSGLLEQISNVLTGFGGQQMGFTGGQSAYGAGWGQSHFDMNDGQPNIEERHLVLMAKSLAQTVRQLSETVKHDKLPWGSSETYLGAILAVTDSLTCNPTGTTSFY